MSELISFISLSKPYFLSWCILLWARAQKKTITHICQKSSWLNAPPLSPQLQSQPSYSLNLQYSICVDSGMYRKLLFLGMVCVLWHFTEGFLIFCLIYHSCSISVQYFSSTTPLLSYADIGQEPESSTPLGRLGQICALSCLYLCHFPFPTKNKLTVRPREWAQTPAEHCTLKTGIPWVVIRQRDPTTLTIPKCQTN